MTGAGHTAPPVERRHHRAAATRHAVASRAFPQLQLQSVLHRLARSDWLRWRRAARRAHTRARVSVGGAAALQPTCRHPLLTWAPLLSIDGCRRAPVPIRQSGARHCSRSAQSRLRKGQARAARRVPHKHQGLCSMLCGVSAHPGIAEVASRGSSHAARAWGSSPCAVSACCRARAISRLRSRLPEGSGASEASGSRRRGCDAPGQSAARSSGGNCPRTENERVRVLASPLRLCRVVALPSCAGAAADVAGGGGSSSGCEAACCGALSERLGVDCEGDGAGGGPTAGASNKAAARGAVVSKRDGPTVLASPAAGAPARRCSVLYRASCTLRVWLQVQRGTVAA